MDIHVSFPGGKRVDASVGTHVIRTDQPAAVGGEDSAPAPFDLFLASLGTCAGIYVLAFCQARGIPTDGLELVEHTGADAISIEIRVPPGFPDKYRDAIVRAAEGCKIKKLLSNPPRIDVCAVQ